MEMMKSLGLGASLPDGCKTFGLGSARPQTAPAALLSVAAPPPAAGATTPNRGSPGRGERAGPNPRGMLRRNQSNAARSVLGAGWNLKEGHTKRLAHPQENVAALPLHKQKSVAQMFYENKSPRGKEQIQRHEETRRSHGVLVSRTSNAKEVPVDNHRIQRMAVSRETKKAQIRRNNSLKKYKSKPQTN